MGFTGSPPGLFGSLRVWRFWQGKCQMCGKCHYCHAVCWQLPFACNIHPWQSSALPSRHCTYVWSASESRGVGGEVVQRGLFAGITQWIPFLYPSIKQPQCMMLKPEAGSDMLLFELPGFTSVLFEGRSESRGSQCNHAVCSLKPSPVAFGLLKAMYSFIII